MDVEGLYVDNGVPILDEIRIVLRNTHLEVQDPKLVCGAGDIV